MTIQFSKYQGTGNDFVILDNRDGKYDSLTVKQVEFLCDRRFGIGADGLMMLNLHPNYDFKMVYYNADGRESTMCGNGGRCLTKFAYDTGLYQMKYRFIAVDGEHESEINEDGRVALKMNDVNHVREDHGNFVLNTGSPHFVKFEQDVEHIDVFKKGREIRYNHEFKDDGINVNFVEQIDHPNKLFVRTYERGVEEETYSCGTGVTACALVSFHNDNGFNHVDVQTKGGMLSVEFDKAGSHYTNIWLIGPAEKVFEGTLELNHL